MQYQIYFLGQDKQRVGRPTMLQLETDGQARQHSHALANLFAGVETWDGTRLICHLPQNGRPGDIGNEFERSHDGIVVATGDGQPSATKAM